MLRHARRKALLAVSTASVVAALSGSSLAAATPLPAQSAQPVPTTAAPAPTTQGIIMRDGGICDPIRHMGC